MGERIPESSHWRNDETHGPFRFRFYALLENDAESQDDGTRGGIGEIIRFHDVDGQRLREDAGEGGFGEEGLEALAAVGAHVFGEVVDVLADERADGGGVGLAGRRPSRWSSPAPWCCRAYATDRASSALTCRCASGGTSRRTAQQVTGIGNRRTPVGPPHAEVHHHVQAELFVRHEFLVDDEGALDEPGLDAWRSLSNGSTRVRMVGQYSWSIA